MSQRFTAIPAGLLLLLGACGGGGGGEPQNVQPTANAGSPQTVASGATVTLNGTGSADSDGSIAGYSWSQVLGTPVTLAGSTQAQPTFVAPTVTAATALRFSLVVTDNDGASSSLATVNITVNPLSGPTVALNGVVRFERVGFINLTPFGLNYASPALRPARGVVVRVLNGSTEVASGVTDGTGAYSLMVPSGIDVTLQVVARMLREGATAPRWNVRVQNGLGSLQPYAYNTPPFSSSSGTRNVDIPTGISPTGTATGTRASGPFAILDTIYTAMQAVLAVAPATDFPALYVDWGTQTAGTHFQRSGNYIALMSGLNGDSDEFDQHVVAHEFGHYIEHNFSRSDSLGGAHTLGDRLDMRIAFGEGFGYAFAAMVLNDPDARDSYYDGTQQRASRFVVETNPAGTLPAFGAGCWCSETSVWSILWDLYDDTPGEAGDGIAMGFAPLWQVLTGPQRTTSSVTSIFSFISALKAARPGDAAAINALLAAQNIVGATMDEFASTETNMPSPNMTPLIAPIVTGTPVIVRSIDDWGLYNKAGNRRLLRFTPTSSGPVFITVVTSNMNPNSDPDYYMYRTGTFVALEEDSPDDELPATRTETGGPFNVTAGTTYIIDAYDCANGCDSIQGVRGDYDLTVTIN